MSKTQNIFRSENHHGFTEDINKTALSSIYDKRIESVDSQKRMHMDQENI